MARFTFGGTVRDLTASPSQSTALGGALVVAANTTLQFYSVSSGGTPVTDYLLDNDGDGVFEAAASSIVTRSDGYLPSFQGPDGITTLYYDPNPADAEVRRVLVIARDATTGGVSPASTTVAGISRLSTATEAVGTGSTTVMTPANVASQIAQHAGDLNAHPTLSAAIASLQSSLASTAQLDANGDVPLSQLPVSTGPVADTLIQRGPQGQAAASAALVDTDLAQLGQVRTLVAAGASGADVRNLAAATQPSSTSATTFTAIPGVRITDAATGQQWRCEFEIIYQATAAAGIQVQFVTPAATVTNVLLNPSMDTDTSDYVAANASTTLSRGTTAGAVGTGFLQLTAANATATTNLAYSGWYPTTPGSVWSAGGQIRRGTGTARPARVDILFSDATGSRTIVGGSFNSPALTPTTTTWTQAKVENVTAPTWATQVGLRLAVQATAVTGDVTQYDALQLEPGATLPAYGNTGGSGSGSLTIVGDWSGLTTGATSSDNYSKRQLIRYPTNTNLTTTHGGLGTTTGAILSGSALVTIGGTNLTGQTIGLEFAQRVVDAANATQIVAANATFARVA